MLLGRSAEQAVLLGVALAATSVGISAQTLREIGQLQSHEGSTVLGAAVIDDVLGIVTLSLALSVLRGQPLLPTLLRMAAFFPVAWIVGNKLVRWLDVFHRHRRWSPGSTAVLLGFLLLYAWTAVALGGVATVTGAYLLGLLVARSNPDLKKTIRNQVATLGYGFLIPFFFINIGLSAHLGSLLGMPWLTAALCIVAILSKVFGCGMGAWIGGLGKKALWRVGLGMVPRGEVTLVVAQLGLVFGLLDDGLFAALIVVVLITTLVTPLLLRLGYAKVVPASLSEQAG